MTQKRALICGVSGQDGAYLAQLLLAKGYHVCGTSRDAQVSGFPNLVRLGIKDRLELLSMVGTDFRSVLNVVARVQPDEIYNLAGQSSVGLSFEQPMETLESIATGTLNLLEVMRFIARPIRFYNASSSECFGATGDQPADETTPFHPRSPYAVAKAAGFWAVANYRDAYGLYACSGLLFNHESPLRPERFVTQKIVTAACRIAAGDRRALHLGNLAIRRDWGWAAEFVDAMHRILQLDGPEDFVIATGSTFSLQQFAETAFQAVGLDWREWVVSDPALHRPSDLLANRGNAAKAERLLGWKARLTMPGVVAGMVSAALHAGAAV
ncbi:MAG: GDP-mannose 4,6-dehydratase [Gammaproteobacteria bacterium]|nr:GDP-mannose 4,6-dehydratase [Gammaproteobacteria bacterium]MBV8307012.1 GDP-mannose 4,6-dehydratase [Gammaproteobacteria bacterium]MBV8403413.1 GDP-mannose 4,6-dehydratase [Gammaproteobacteria bacterium]